MRPRNATNALIAMAATLFVACGSCGSHTAGGGGAGRRGADLGGAEEAGPGYADAAREAPEPSASTEGGGFCPALPPPEGRVLRAGPSDVAALADIVRRAGPGDTVLLEDGTYLLRGVSIQLETPGVTLRSASGDRDRVVLDGGYDTEEPIAIRASDVTVADLTVRRAVHHPIHIAPQPDRSIRNALVYNVVVEDPGQQGIKVNPNGRGFADEGVIACSRIVLTDAGRPRIFEVNDECYTGGIDIHRGRGWLIRDNHIEGFFCDRELSEHGVHVWKGCRDTVVERNVIVNCARGIGLGMLSDGEGRQYPDRPCADRPRPDHFGGVVRNNVILADRGALFDSEAGFDNGISLWSACDARVLHNTVVSTREPFASIEARYPGARVELLNNLTSHRILERDGASVTARGNVEGAAPSLFVDVRRGDLHLAPTAASAVDRGVPVEGGGCDHDIDGDRRDESPDVGADELHRGTP